jgi:hypothetical protein
LNRDDVFFKTIKFQEKNEYIVGVRVSEIINSSPEDSSVDSRKRQTNTFHEHHGPSLN